MQTQTSKVGLVACFIAVLLAACSPGGNTGDEGAQTPPNGEAPPKPVTLNVFTDANATMDVEVELVKKKFPHVTLNVIKNSTETRIEQVVASGQQLDLINHSMGSIWKLMDLQLLSDLTPFIEKEKFDLNIYPPGIVESIRSYSPKNEMLALPYELNSSVLFYNKALFDKFGLSYPKDGLTWDDTLELARRLTQKDGDVQYKGFQFQHQNLTWKNQLGLPLVNPSTNKSLVNTDGWKRFIETMGGFYLIPGNEMVGTDTDNFLVKQTLAMRVGPNILSRIPDAVKTGLDWDAAAVPVFKGSTSGGSQLIAPFYSIPVAGRHKETAFQVMAYLMSDEVQMIKSRVGRMTILKNEAVQKAFASELPGVAGKNIAAFFKETIGKAIPVTKYDAIAKDQIWSKSLSQYAAGTKDVNTVLREADEAINKAIEEQIKMGK